MKISVKDKRPRKLEEWDGVYENTEAKGTSLSKTSLIFLIIKTSTRELNAGVGVGMEEIHL